MGLFSRGLRIARYYKQNVSGVLPYYLGVNSDRSVSINVNKTRSIFPETFMARACFPNVSQFPIRETLFPVSAFVSKMQIILRIHGREF